MAAPNKAKIALGAQKSHHFPMSAPHLTTSDFFDVQPVLVNYVPRSMHGKFTAKSFTRLLPLPEPVMSQCSENTRAFFVPMYTIWESWFEFMTNTLTVDSEEAQFALSVPFFKSSTLLNFLVSSPLNLVTATTGANDADFTANGGTYKFTGFGKFVAKVLKTCGYVVLAHDKDDYLEFSALPLLAYIKVCLDFYYPSQYFLNDVNSIAVQKILNRRGSYELSKDDLDAIFTCIPAALYDNDYFVDAFDTATAPAYGSAYMGVSLPDITFMGVQDTPGSSAYHIPTTVSVESDGVSDGVALDATLGTGNAITITNYSLQMLQSLAQLVKRHQLVGSRAIDRWLADYGLAIASSKVRRSQLLGSHSSPIQFADVMSNASTSGADLGDYAGKGVAFNDCPEFEFNCGEDDGFIIVISTTIPKVTYQDGYKKQVRALTALQYYQPDFDGKTTEAIEEGELVVRSISAGVGEAKTVFGFKPIYSWIKSLLGTVSGDFDLHRFLATYSPWHLGRMFSGVRYGNDSAVYHSPNFIRGIDKAQYNRIFAITDADLGDPFVKIFHFDFDVYANMLPLYDDYLLSHGKGKKAKMEINGFSLN